MDPSSAAALRAGAANASAPDALAVAAFQGQHRRAELVAAVRWIRQGAWAILDQALFGVANLVVNVALARSLQPEAYGAFAAAYSAFLLVSIAHTALLSQPLMVFGTEKYAHARGAYLRAVLAAHWMLTSLAAAVLLAGAGLAAVAGERAAALCFAALAVASPVILLQWLLRRVCYMRQEPGRAAAAGALYAAIVAFGLVVLTRRGMITGPTTLALMAVASALSSAAIRLPRRSERGTVGFAEVAADHLRFGRWTASSGFIEAAGQNAYFLLLPLLAGLESAAAMKALMNVEMPLLQGFSALSVLLVGTLVRLNGTRAFMRVVYLITALFSVVSAGTWLLVGLNGERVLHLAYGGRYDAYAAQLWVAGLLPIAIGTCGVLGAAFHALRRPDVVFRVAAVSGAIGVAGGIALAGSLGVAGATVGIVLPPAITAVLLLVRVKRINTRAGDAPEEVECRD